MSLFIGRLNTRIDKRDLEDLFHKFGRIRRCDVKNGQGPFNFGFIEYEDKRDAEDAIRGLDGKVVINSSLGVLTA